MSEWVLKCFEHDNDKDDANALSRVSVCATQSRLIER